MSEQTRFVEQRLDLRRGASQVAAFDSRGHRNHRLQIVAIDLGLAGEQTDLCHPAERDFVAVGRANQEPAHVVGGRTLRGRNPDAHVDGPIHVAHLGRDGPRKIRLDLLRDEIGVEAFQPGLQRIDVDIERVSRDDHAIPDLGHAGNRHNRLRDLGRNLVKDRRVVAEDLDLDGLRNRREVADQIFHELRGLDIESGYGLLGPLADLRHDLLDVAPGRRFQAHKNIADIGLREGTAKLQPRTPRIGEHLRRRAENLLHLLEHRVGVLKRVTRRGDVIEDEAAFVHDGHEARAHLGVGQISGTQERGDHR